MYIYVFDGTIANFAIINIVYSYNCYDTSSGRFKILSLHRPKGFMSLGDQEKYINSPMLFHNDPQKIISSHVKSTNLVFNLYEVYNKFFDTCMTKKYSYIHPYKNRYIFLSIFFFLN